jgi:aspartate/glutamate/glutamine transport system substrate-binding protein
MMLPLHESLSRNERSWHWVAITVLVLVALVGLIACKPSTNTNNPISQPLLQQIKQRGTLLAGVKFDCRPFGYLDVDGHVKGYDVDLMGELAYRILGRREAVEFQQVLSATRILALESGNVDVVAATMTITPEREQLIDFSDSYFLAGQGVLVPKHSGVSRLADLKGKRILLVMGSTSERNIKRLLPQASYIGYKTITDAFSAMKAHRGEALTSDDVILTGLLQSDKSDFKILPDRLSAEPYGLGVKQDASTHSFRLAINQALAAMQTDGTLARLKAKWLTP